MSASGFWVSAYGSARILRPNASFRQFLPARAAEAWRITRHLFRAPPARARWCGHRHVAPADRIWPWRCISNWAIMAFAPPRSAAGSTWRRQSPARGGHGPALGSRQRDQSDHLVPRRPSSADRVPDGPGRGMVEITRIVVLRDDLVERRLQADAGDEAYAGKAQVLCCAGRRGPEAAPWSWVYSPLLACCVDTHRTCR